MKTNFRQSMQSCRCRSASLVWQIVTVLIAVCVAENSWSLDSQFDISDEIEFSDFDAQTSPDPHEQEGDRVVAVPAGHSDHRSQQPDRIQDQADEDESDSLSISSTDSGHDLDHGDPQGRMERVHSPIQAKHLDDGRPIEIGKPNQQQLNEFLDAIYGSQNEILNKMKSFVVGLRGQDRLLTLADAYHEKLFSAEETGAILSHVDDFNSGETKTLKLRFGLRSGEDIVIGRYPNSLIARPAGTEAFNPNDPAMAPFIKWLQVLGHMTWVQPYGPGSGVGVNTMSGYTHDVQLRSLSASVSAYHWSEERMRGFSSGASITGGGASAFLETSTANSTNGVWFSVMDGWGGLGYSGKFNIEENQLSLSSLGVGAWVAGWKDYLQFGASVSVVGPGCSSIGVGGVMSLSKDRQTSYLNRYNGQFDEIIKRYIKEYTWRRTQLDDELAVTKRLVELMRSSDLNSGVHSMKKDIRRIQKEMAKLSELISSYQKELTYLENKHFIEVIDKESKGLRLDGGAHIAGIGLGFRAGADKGSQSIHRFYTHLDRAQELLKDGDGSKLALLRLPKKFDRAGFPDVRKPHRMKIGEEVITTIERTFYGSLVVGMQGVPGIDVRAGLSSTVTGTFEMGMRKLPGNKLEVSIKPSEIKEMGAFLAAINTVGPQLSIASTIALAMRMTFIFDLNSKEAVDTYSLLLTGGVLPIEFSPSDAVVGPREAENLLDVAIIHRKALAEKGILLTYLEKVDIPARKFYVGVGKLPLISAKSWAGLSYEYLNGQSKVVSTNGQIAVSRFTSHVSETVGRGTSGFEESAAYATIKRSFIKSDGSESIFAEGEDLSDGYVWRFKGITLRAKLSDTKITGTDHDKMVEKMNSMFHANLEPFSQQEQKREYRQNREVLLERRLTSKDLDSLARIKQKHIDIAVRGSGLSRSKLTNLLADIEDKGHNQVANILKDFVAKHGIRGVSAIHLMLKGGCRNLVIRTTSNSYSDPLIKANRLEASHSNPQSTGENRYLDVDYSTPEKKVKKMFKDVNEVLRELDQALRDLAGDPLFEGEDDLLKFENGQREKKTILRSKLLAAKSHMLDLIDLEKQGFDQDTVVETYKKISENDRALIHRLVLLKDKYKRPISIHQKRKSIGKRWKYVQRFMDDVKKERRSLEAPETLRVMRSVFVSSRREQLDHFLREAAAMIDVGHLRDQSQAFIKKMRKRKFRFLSPKAIYREIAAHVERVLYDSDLKKV